MALQTGLELVAHLRSGRKFLADGAVGSELIRLGVAPDGTVAANVSHPEQVRSLHRAAIAAGAELITTNTFGYTGDRAWAQAFAAGIGIAQTEARAASRPITVMVSVFPDELLRGAEEALSPILASMQEVLLIETAVDIREAVAAVALARRQGVRIVAATCHFEPGGAMPDGTTSEQAAVALQGAGASIVGANCGAEPEDMWIVAQRMRSVTDLPLIFQPNAGLPQREGDRWIYPVSPARFAANADRLFDAGAAIVGGCCGTTPAHIAAVGSRLFHPQRRE